MNFPAPQVNFFNDCKRERDWTAPDYAAYHARFPSPVGDQLWGDFTPSYLFRPYAIDRMAAYNPNMKVICIFRDPCKRAFSHWKQISMCDCACGEGNCPWVKEELSFSAAIRTDRGPPGPPPDPFLALCNRDGYVNMGLYGAQVRKLYEVFPREQVLCLRSDHLEQSPSTALVEVCRFLGVQPFPWDVPRMRVHEGVPGGVSMPAEDEQYLREVYKDDLALFARLSGLDVSDWIDPTCKRQAERKVGFVVTGDSKAVQHLFSWLCDVRGISLAPNARAPALRGRSEWATFGQPTAPPLSVAAVLDRHICNFWSMPPDAEGSASNFEQHISRYHGMFDEDNAGLRGECSPSYFFCRPALTRMKQYNPV